MNQNLKEDAMIEEAIASAEISMNISDTGDCEKESNLIEHNGNYYVRCETHEEVIRRLQEKHEEALSSRDTYWKERVRKEVEDSTPVFEVLEDKARGAFAMRYSIKDQHTQTMMIDQSITEIPASVYALKVLTQANRAYKETLDTLLDNLK